MFWPAILISVLLLAGLIAIGVAMVNASEKPRHDAEDTPLIPTPDDGPLL